MQLIRDLLQQLAGSVHLFREREPAALWRYLLGGLLVAACCWLACSYYTRLWNLKYRLSRGHHTLCGLAAAFTFCFALIYPSLDYLADTAKQSIAAWKQALEHNDEWSHRIFLAEYEAAKVLNAETALSEDQHTLTFGHDDASQLAAANVVVRAAADDFAARHPFLDKVLTTRTEVPAQLLHDDMTAYWARTPGGQGGYPTTQGIELVASLVKSQLDSQTPRVVAVVRVGMIGLFVSLQILVLATTGIAAYRDLKSVT